MGLKRRGVNTYLVPVPGIIDSDDSVGGVPIPGPSIAAAISQHLNEIPDGCGGSVLVRKPADGEQTSQSVGPEKGILDVDMCVNNKLTPAWEWNSWTGCMWAGVEGMNKCHSDCTVSRNSSCDRL